MSIIARLVRQVSAQRNMLIGLFLRCLSIGGRYVANILVLDALGVDALGDYSLFSATISVAILLVGFEFHQISRREIIVASPEQIVCIIRDVLMVETVIFGMFVAAVGLSAESMRAVLGVGPHFALFCVVLGFSSLSGEVSRVLAARTKTLAAISVGVYTNAAWIFVAALLLVMGYRPRGIDSFYEIWGVTNGIGVVGAFVLLRDLPWHKALFGAVDFGQIWRRMRGAVLFLGTLMLTMLVNYADRYMLALWHGNADAGIYAFFSNVARAPDMMINSVVLIVALPLSYRAATLDDEPALRSELRKAALQIGFITVVGVLLGVGSLVVAAWTKQGDAVVAHWPTMAILTLSGVLVALAQIFHIALYARQRDKVILLSSLASAGTTVGLLALTVPRWGMNAAALSVLSGSIVLIGLKAGFALPTLRRRHP